jgi:hypothetical protein
MHRFEQEVPPSTTIWDQVYDNHDSNLTLEIYKDCALDEPADGMPSSIGATNSAGCLPTRPRRAD